MADPWTIVLPVFNAERFLKRAVLDVLELGAASARGVRVVLVDDGSTDDTYEVGCELARAYPQVCCLRQPFQRGLGPALDRARRELGLTEAIVHDGISRIDLNELASLLAPADGLAPPAASGSRVPPRFAAVAVLNQRLQHVHRPLTSFRWLQMEPRGTSRRGAAPPLPPIAVPPVGADLTTSAGR